MTTGDATMRAAWSRLLDTNASAARANVEVQVELLAGVEGDPDEVAERLAGVDGAAAEALVVLGPLECDELLTRLAARVRVAASILSEAPTDAVAALLSLGVASCWNDIVCAGRRELLAGDDPTGAWLHRLAQSPAADDPELERRLAFVVPAVGGDELNRELVEAGPSGAPVPQPEDLGPVLAAAVLAGGRAEAVMEPWREWLVSAPEWLSDGMLEWQDLLWAARAVHARLGGEPPDHVVRLLRAATLGEPA